jgi:hypothetical protein
LRRRQPTRIASAGERFAPIVAFAGVRPRALYTSGCGARCALALPQPDQGRPLPKPNYAFQKRQRDLAKQQKKEEKQKKKAASKAVPAEAETQPPAPDSSKPEP